MSVRESRGREPLAERLPFDVLHRDVVLAVSGLAERVDRADVGVVEGGGRARFLLEALDAERVAGQVGGKTLERPCARGAPRSRATPRPCHPRRGAARFHRRPGGSRD